MAYDPATRQLLLFGGYSETDGYFNDTWTWTGSTWRRLHPKSIPSARRDQMMAWDPSTRQMLLFGGCSDESSFCTTGCLSDTWLWTGRNWHQASPSVSPPCRYSGGLAYSPLGKQLILFGGWASDGAFYNDTWAWTGVNWKELDPVTSPPARGRFVMATDPISGNIIVFGGFAWTCADTLCGDTWAWNGVTWYSVPTKVAPTPRSDSVMAVDPRYRSLVLIGGDANPPSYAQTWLWGFGRRGVA